MLYPYNRSVLIMRSGSFPFMKIALLPLFLFSLCCLCAANWTVLVYMAADNNLAQSGKHNLNEMESATQPEGLNLVVQADFPGERTKRYLIEQDADPDHITSNVIKDMANTDSGDPNTLRDFIIWGRNRYPAERYMLVIWAHGDSWYKGSKWISPDDETSNLIGIANGELKSALVGTGDWDILLFDACSMQSVEIITEMQDLTDYVVASADLVPATGFPYAQIIPLLHQAPSSVAEQIPELYQQSYLPGEVNNPSNQYLTTTCSAISTAGFGAFIEHWKSFSASMRSYASELADIRGDLFEMNTGYADVDLRQLLVRLSANGIPGSTALLDEWNSLILASAFTLPYSESDVGTAAIWFPDSRYNYNAAWQHYMKLDFSRTGWLGVVNISLGDPYTAPESPDLISANTIFDRLILDIAAPLSPDSLHYQITINDDEYTLSPSAYSPQFQFTASVEQSGSWSVTAIDQNGLRSDPLQGLFTLSSEIDQPMIVYPNPMKVPLAGRLIWKQPSESVNRLSVGIFNIRGQKVAERMFDADIPQGELYLLDIDGFSELKRGIYLIHLRLGKRDLRCKLTIL